MSYPGSFMSSFPGMFGNSQGTIDDLLERQDSDLTLEEVLAHPDVIQECKFMNEGLLNYLSRPEVAERMVKYVIEKPPEDSEETKHDPKQPSMYPYMASELFGCENMSMIEVFFSYPDLLRLLFTYLDQPSPLDPATSGYFRKVLVVLVQRKHDQLVQFIKQEKLVGKMVNHIGLYAVTELLIMVGWDDGTGQNTDTEWLYNDDLIPRLLAKIDPKFEKEADVHSNASRVLADIVNKAPAFQASLLVSHLQSPPILDKLFEYMWCGSVSSLMAALRVLVSLIHREAERRGEIQAEINNPDYDESAMAQNVTPLIDRTRQHLPAILKLLTNPPAGETWVTPTGVLKPLGETRLRIVEMLVGLVRCNYDELNDEIIKADSLNVVLDLFFEYQWNGFLHSMTELLIRTILETRAEKWRNMLFKQVKLISRMLKGYRTGASSILNTHDHHNSRAINGEFPPADAATDSAASSSSASTAATDSSASSTSTTAAPAAATATAAAADATAAAPATVAATAATLASSSSASSTTASSSSSTEPWRGDKAVVSTNSIRRFRPGYMSHLIRICDAIPKYCAADKELDDTVNALDDAKEWVEFLEGPLNMEYNIYGQLSAMRPKRPPPPSAAPPHPNEYASSEASSHPGDTFTPIFVAPSEAELEADARRGTDDDRDAASQVEHMRQSRKAEDQGDNSSDSDEEGEDPMMAANLLPTGSSPLADATAEDGDGKKKKKKKGKGKKNKNHHRQGSTDENNLASDGGNKQDQEGHSDSDDEDDQFLRKNFASSFHARNEDEDDEGTTTDGVALTSNPLYSGGTDPPLSPVPVEAAAASSSPPETPPAVEAVPS